jgi:hypothetical protein
MIDVPLGTLIFRAGLLGEEQLEDALQEGMRTGKRLGEVLLERGWLNERDLGQMLAGQKGLPFVDVNLGDVEPDALGALAEDDARRQVALPLFYDDGELVVAVGDPSNEVVLEGLRRELEGDFQLVVAPHSQLQQVIDAAYSRPAPAPELAPAPAPQRDGVLFPDLVPPAKDEAPARHEPEGEAQPDHGFASAVEPELEADDGADGEEKPFAGSTPTLLSRMLFPSVRHTAQETEAAVEEAEEPEPTAEAPSEPAEAPAPEAVDESAPAEEDFAELEVPAVPEMPVSAFDQPVAEAEPAPAEETSQPAAEQPAEQPQPEHSAEEPQAEQSAVEPQPEQPAAEPQAEQPSEQPPSEDPAEEPPAEEPQAAEPQPAEPQAEESQPEEQQPEEAHPARHFVVVRLRDGESLRIGEHADAAGASAQAAEAVAQISAASGNGTWPFFAGRYLSPDTIVSVDLVDETPDA